ncbi:MAG: hypothetical protein ABF449_05230, partial [Ethanoligenens sp.]
MGSLETDFPRPRFRLLQTFIRVDELKKGSIHGNVVCFFQKALCAAHIDFYSDHSGACLAAQDAFDFFADVHVYL